jgi:hypothetical protein
MNQPAMFETDLAPYFTTKAPFQFPLEFREGFVKYWPIVLLVLMVLSIGGLVSLFAIISVLGLGSLGLLLSVVGIVLGLLSLPGLFNRKRQGWVFSYYGQLISILSSVLSLFSGGSAIIGILLGLVFLTLLFQVREYYN